MAVRDHLIIAVCIYKLFSVFKGIRVAELFLVCFLVFLGPYPMHMEVPRPGVELEL